MSNIVTLKTKAKRFRIKAKLLRRMQENVCAGFFSSILPI